MHVKWSAILADRFGLEILNRLEITYLKVPGWLFDLNELLTRKLSMFLSRLNEIVVLEEIYV